MTDSGSPTDRVVAAIEGLEDGAVHYVKDNESRSIIDFAFGEHEDVPLYERVRSGEWGSSVLVDDVNAEVDRATLRLGSLGLPEGADLFYAKVQIEQLAEKADPPVETSILEEKDTIYVRFRDMSAGVGDILNKEGFDIVHINVNRGVPVDGFVPWMERFVRLYNREKGRIRQETIELGFNDD